jgi:SapC
MIDPSLFTEPVALDRVQHRQMRLKPDGIRFDRVARKNSLFITAIEFGDVCREYPIVFVDAGKDADGHAEVAPLAVIGLAPGENLMLGSDGRWAARYVPAMLRAYPLGLARIDGERYSVCVDAGADALSEAEGERLFDDAGEPSAYLANQRRFLEEIERETQRTRQFGRRLLDLDLLRPMRFDATLPDGNTLSVDGFFTVDDQKLSALPDAAVVDLHRSGLLALIDAHRISLGLMRTLVERRLAQRATA